MHLKVQSADSSTVLTVMVVLYAQMFCLLGPCYILHSYISRGKVNDMRDVCQSFTDTLPATLL